METYKTKGGKLRYREEIRGSNFKNGRLRSPVFKRKFDAELWKKRMEVQKAMRINGVEQIEPKKFSDLADAWFEQVVRTKKRIKTVENYRSSINSNLKKVFGDCEANEIRFDFIERWVLQMEKNGAAPATINKELTVLRQILNFGFTKGHISRSPLADRSLSRTVKKTRFDFYSFDEISGLLESNNDHWIYPILYCSVHTGMRPSELFGLRWKQINLLTNQIEITHAFVRNVLQDSTKNDGHRFFPLTSSLRKMFEEMGTGNLDEFVFKTKKGRPFSSDHFCERHFDPATKRANIRRLRFYDLRHTFASQFMMNGGSIFELSKLLGHSSLEMTMDICASLTRTFGKSCIDGGLREVREMRICPSPAPGAESQ